MSDRCYFDRLNRVTPVLYVVVCTILLDFCFKDLFNFIFYTTYKTGISYFTYLLAVSVIKYSFDDFPGGPLFNLSKMTGFSY